ncbi:MAG TPA: hypothetical protein DEQ40_09175, partial [Oxalobacteraceae bacterium]|nr:hypothetical protein [Oxalobacteraceae bacterium]
MNMQTLEKQQVLDAIPTNWLDNLLTGDEAVLRGNGGTWGCPDIERLLKAVRQRINDLPVIEN